MRRAFLPLALGLLCVGCAEGSTVDVPPEPTDAGTTNPCTPLPDTSTHGATCDSPIFIGTLSDAAGDLLNIEGNGMAGAEVWYSFSAPDDTDTAGDEFHVDVRFLDNPRTGYQMDMFRDGCSAATQVATGETEVFDWYTDFASTDVGCTVESPCGEGDCVPVPGEEGKNTCDDDSASFYMKISRIDGEPSCDHYEIALSNGYYQAN